MFHTHSLEWVWNILLLRSDEAASNVDHVFSLLHCLKRCSWWRQKLLFHFLSMKFCSQNVCWLLCCCGSPRACKHFCVCVCVSLILFLNKIHVLFCFFSLHLPPVNLRLVWNLHSLISLLTVVSFLWCCSWCHFNMIPCLCGVCEWVMLLSEWHF